MLLVLAVGLAGSSFSPSPQLLNVPRWAAPRRAWTACAKENDEDYFEQLMSRYSTAATPSTSPATPSTSPGADATSAGSDETSAGAGAMSSGSGATNAGTVATSSGREEEPRSQSKPTQQNSGEGRWRRGPGLPKAPPYSGGEPAVSARQSAWNVDDIDRRFEARKQVRPVQKGSGGGRWRRGPAVRAEPAVSASQSAWATDHDLDRRFDWRKQPRPIQKESDPKGIRQRNPSTRPIQKESGEQPAQQPTAPPASVKAACQSSWALDYNLQRRLSPPTLRRPPGSVRRGGGQPQQGKPQQTVSGGAPAESASQSAWAINHDIERRFGRKG